MAIARDVVKDIRKILSTVANSYTGTGLTADIQIRNIPFRIDADSPVFALGGFIEDRDALRRLIDEYLTEINDAQSHEKNGDYSAGQYHRDNAENCVTAIMIPILELIDEVESL